MPGLKPYHGLFPDKEMNGKEKQSDLICRQG